MEQFVRVAGAVSFPLVVSSVFWLGWLTRRVLKQARATELTLGDPAVSTSDFFALRLADLTDRETMPVLLGRIELVSHSELERHRLVASLRTIVVRGLDEIFVDERGVWIVVLGRGNPFRIGGYFDGELRAHEIAARSSWAYSSSAEVALRRQLRSVAIEGLKSGIPGGLAVKVLPVGEIGFGCTAGTLSDSTSENRRSATGLDRLELATAIGVTIDEYVAWETGRECSPDFASRLSLRLALIEKALAHAAKQPPKAGQ